MSRRLCKFVGWLIAGLGLFWMVPGALLVAIGNRLMKRCTP